MMDSNIFLLSQKMFPLLKDIFYSKCLNDLKRKEKFIQKGFSIELEC